jgi:transposase
VSDSEWLAQLARFGPLRGSFIPAKGSLDRYLVAAMNPYAWAWRLLQTIPGIDQISAAMILIEISDDLRRFGSASRLASWAALCPGNNESAGKRKTGKVRHGNPIVRYM